MRAASRQGEVRFDWTDPETWEPAVAGVAGMYLMAPHGQPVEPAFVRLAIDEGVRRIVLLSGRGIEVMGDERLIAAERTVREPGAEWTIVRSDADDIAAVAATALTGDGHAGRNYEVMGPRALAAIVRPGLTGARADWRMAPPFRRCTRERRERCSDASGP